MTSKQDQMFGANPEIGEKIVLLSCINITHPISRLQAGQPTVAASYPEGGVLLQGQFSELNSSGFREKLGYPAIDHTLKSKKKW